MNLAGNRHVPGWHYIGDTKDGLWGKFFPAGHERPRGFARSQSKPQAEARSLLNPVARDRAYREFLDSLQLAPDHREDLRKRGLTDAQIDRGGFATLEPGDRHKIEGIATGSRHRGYLCPIRDAGGRLLGCQIRLDKGENGRYRWLKSGKVSSHLPNGELPLQVAASVGEPQRIVPIEGTLKPDIVALLWPGTVAIGASGGNFAGCQEQLRQAIAAYPGLPIFFAPDAGCLANRHVRRRDVGTVKLLQGWGYEPQILDWGQLYDKQALDLDDWLAADGDADAIAPIDTDEYLAHADTSWLQYLRGALQNRRSKRRGPVLVDATDPAIAPPTQENEILQYPAHTRLAIWQTLAADREMILDTSDTGGGKSYDTGRIEPADFNCQKVWYVTNDPRNVSTQTLTQANGWTLVEGRHGGLTVDRRGQIRIWKRGDDTMPTQTPNCARPQTIAALRSLGIGQADEASTICTTCSHFGGCKSGNGAYRYLDERRKAIAQTKRIVHPNALPDPTSYDYSQDLVVFDESTNTLRDLTTLSVSPFEIAKWLDETYACYPQIYEQIQPILMELRALLGKRKAPDPYGWKHHEIVAALQPLLPASPDLDAIARIAGPIDAILNPAKEYGVETADLPQHLRKQLLDRDAVSAEKLKESGLQQFVLPLLSILAGGHGTLFIQGGRLQISQGDRYLANILQAAKRAILLDATGDRHQLANMADVPVTAIAPTQQIETATPHLKVTQIVGCGRMGAMRGADQTHRADALVAQLKSQHQRVGVIDWKKYARGDADEGYWFADSRGRNDFEACDALVLVGTPCSNINALVAEFEATYHYVPASTTHTVARSMQATNAPPGKQYQLSSNESTDPQFAEFVRSRILAEYRQAIGRLRANRRPQTPLTCYIISDYVLDISVEMVEAGAVILEAASKSDRNLIGILDAALQLFQNSVKITSGAIASAIGKTDSRVRQLLGPIGGMTGFRRALETLLTVYMAKLTLGDRATWDWIANEYLPLFTQHQGDEGLLEEVAVQIDAGGWEHWQQIANALLPDVRKQVLVAFLRFSPKAWLEELLAGATPLDPNVFLQLEGRGVP